MDFDYVVLKPMSKRVLLELAKVERIKAVDLAERLNLTQAQVNAVITKTLVRHGFAIREAQLTVKLKKAYNLVCITPLGLKYARNLRKREEEKETMNIILHSTHCPKCEVLKEKLVTANIEFTENNDVQIMKALGMKSAPILQVGNELLTFAEGVEWVRRTLES